MVKSNTNQGQKMNAIEAKIATMTETQIVDGLRYMGDTFGFLDSGKWSDAEREVRACLLCALEDHHGWSDYRADVLDADLFWGPESVANVHAMNAALDPAS